MRCSVTIRTRRGPRPCERPAVVVYPVDGTPYGRCQHHDSRECRQYAARYGIERREVPLAPVA